MFYNSAVVDSILMVRSRREWFVFVVASLVLCSLLVPAVAVGVATTHTTDSTHTSIGQVDDTAFLQEFEADRTEFHVTVYENGSATWLFRYETQLTTAEERDDFDAFAEEFNTQETELYTNFRDRAVELAAAGSNATDREMEASAFQRTARTEGLDPQGDDLGIVEMSFRWSGFAETTDQVVVGDVFEGGLYLSSDQRFIVHTGPNLMFRDIQPGDGMVSGDTLADSESVTWQGERSFTDNRPRAVLLTPTATATQTGSDGATPVAGDPGWLLPVGAFVVVVVLGVGTALAYRSGALPPGEDGFSGFLSGSDAGGSAVATSGAAGEAGMDGETGAAVPDEELISDEERVVNLLEENGGRMKQVNIVDATGWSKSKVSMLLSEMEDTGTISKLRVGRENIVSLSGHEPDAAGSPFDNDS